MYLTHRAIAERLTALGGLAEGTELIADHIYPRQVLDRAGRRLVDALARAAGTGEPWRTQLAPDELTDCCGGPASARSGSCGNANWWTGVVAAQ